MLETVYTIGYAGFAIEDFLAVLQDRGISALVDVRSSPFSSFHQAYNRDGLAQALGTRHIHYRSYAREFGARQTDRQYYNAQHCLDFEAFARSEPFLNGVQKLKNGMDQGFRFALMCAETDPIDCHRAILVARAFSGQGYPVVHLCPKGRTLTHKELELRLLDRYFPDRDQCSMFAAAQDEAALLAEAYRLRNAEIGYRIQEDET